MYNPLRALTLCLVLILSLPAAAAAATAAQVKTFAVTPFAVHGPEKYGYLSKGIQSMLYTRMTWPNHLQPVDRSKADKAASKPPESDAQAADMIAAVGCDYLVSGSLTVTGDDASLDIMVVDASGKKWPKTLQTKLSNLIPSLEKAAKAVNAEIFKRPGNKRADGKETINQLNPSFVVNQTNEMQKVYLNPNFRYVGPTQTPGIWRSQSLPFQSFGVDIGDVDGDGKNDIAILGENSIQLFSFQERQLKALAKYETFPNLELLNINIFDYNADGAGEIFVSAYMHKEPRSMVLSYKNGQLTPIMKDVKLFMNTAKVPPDFSRMLVGGKAHKKDLFARGVHEIMFSGGEPVLGTRLNLPKKANPFNFAYLPLESGYKVILIDENDRLNVYSATGERLAQTEEKFCGSGLGLEYDPLLPPMYKPDQNYLWLYYYIPLPIIAANLDGDNKYEVVVSKNISVASQFFENYRAFSQGEIHAMYWDGVGLNLKWKTRRIKGTVSGYRVADIDNDGEVELVVSINTWPGAVGFLKRRTLLYAYELDASTPAPEGYSNEIEVVN